MLSYMGLHDLPIVLCLGGFGEFAEFVWFEIVLEKLNFAGTPKRDFLNWRGSKQTPQTPKLPQPFITPTSRVSALEVCLLLPPLGPDPC
jgi:hypothetical protein